MMFDFSEVRQSLPRMLRPPNTDEVRVALERRIGTGSGYVLEQVHGQRKLFNPLWREAFTPPEGSEVFVGRLPRDCFEDEIVPPFLSVGPIFEFRTMMNFSGTNRGFAFVTYFNKETALRAVDLLNNLQIRKGQAIGVLPSVNNRKLFIGGLKGTEKWLKAWIQDFTEGVENVSVSLARRFEASSGYAVVTYSNHRQAAMARRALIPVKNDIFGPHVTIDWADPALGRGHHA